MIMIWDCIIIFIWKQECLSCEGCDATQNRLYWDPVSNEFYDPSNYNGERVDVTQVRPNDGRTWSGTIAVWEVNK